MNRLRKSWYERAKDPAFRKVAADCAPLPCPMDEVLKTEAALPEVIVTLQVCDDVEGGGDIRVRVYN